MKNRSELKIIAVFFLLFCFPVFSQENRCKLYVESVGLDLESDHLDRFDPDFVSFLKKSHLGFVVSIDELPPKEKEFIVLVDRPLFENGFLGLTKEQVNKKIKICKEQFLINQKNFSCPRPVVLIFSSAGYAPGEPVEVRLLDHNEKELANTSFIPCPLSRKFKDGKAEISFECISFEYSFYRVAFSGFANDEIITFESASGFERIPPTELPVKNGNIKFNYSNAVVGMKGGVSRFTVIRDDGEKVVAKLPWGSKLFEYFKGKLAYGDQF